MKQFVKQVFASMVGFILAWFLTVFGMMFFFGVLIGVLSSQKEDQKVHVKANEPKILKLALSGQVVERLRFQEFFIGDDVPFFGEDSPIGLFELEQTFKRAAKDDSVKGLYLTMGRLHAGWGALNSIHQALTEFKKAGKFIYVYASSFDEATYYLATPADTIFMYPQGGFELDGLQTIMGFMKGTLDKLEVQPQVFRAGDYKSAVEPFTREQMSDENREQISAFSKDVWAVFARTVAQARELEESELDRLAAGLLVNNAADALKYKFVDQLKHEDEVLDFLKGVIGVEADKKLPFVALNRYLSSKAGLGEARRLLQISKSKSSSDPRLAVIFADGDIHQGESQENSVGARTVISAIREAREDKNVKAVVLRVNSPGGDALASDEIWREVVLTDQVKPVVASFGDIAASGGYYIAAGARRVFAQTSTLTGSIGVFGLLFVAKDFFKNKLGVSFDRVVTHPSADMGGLHRKVTEAESFVINKEIDRIYNRFLSVVEEGRKLPVDKLRAISGGRIWSGWAAQRLKLVDELGGLSAAMDEAAALGDLGEDYQIQMLPKPQFPFGRLMQLLTLEAKKALGIPVRITGMWEKYINGNSSKPLIMTVMPMHVQMD